MSVTFYAVDADNKMIQLDEDNSLELNVHNGGAAAIFEVLQLTDKGYFGDEALIERKILDILSLLRANPELDGERETAVYSPGEDGSGAGARLIDCGLSRDYLTTRLTRLHQIVTAALLASGKVEWY